MKHGIFYAYWVHEWGGDFCYYVDKVARLGFDILEIQAAELPEYSDERIAELKQHADEQGILLTTGYGPSPDKNIAAKDAQAVNKALNWYQRLFEKMAALDSHTLCGGLNSYWPYDFSDPDPKEEEWKRSVDGMVRMADLAAPYAIDICCEVLNRFEGYLLNTAEEAVQYVQDVGKDNVKVHLDTFHMNIEEDDMAAAIRTAGPYLGHVHTGEANRRVPGQGNRVPWAEVGAALREVGYDGNVVMEPFVQMGGPVGADIKIWRDMSHGATEEELDRDAAEALQFQKKMLEG